MTGRQPIAAAALAALVLPTAADAQVLGTFRWQLRPYCNIVTLVVTQVGGVYRVEGTDDQCGAATSASVTGTAFPNRNGSIGLGLNLVTAPGGTASPVNATIALSTLSGTWRGPGGSSGAFAALTGTPVPGTPRPLPPAVVVPAEISLLSGGSLVARAEGSSAIPASGPGSRMMWYAGKSAFRSGRVESDAWDDANIGLYSTALGYSTVAAAAYSTAVGYETRATGAVSTALGNNSFASGASSTATGLGTIASGEASFAGGYQSEAGGAVSTAFGVRSNASGSYSTAFGHGAVAAGEASTAIGEETVASGMASTAIGFSTAASGIASFAIGHGSGAGGNSSFAGGFASSAVGSRSFAFGTGNGAYGNYSVIFGINASTTAAAFGSFVFTDASSTSSFVSYLPNEFGARFAGGYYLYSSANLGTGVAVAANGSSWAALSDVNAKEHFRDIDGEDLLARLARVPIREWSYKAQDAGIRHMGPTAQDFRAAFGLGDFPLRINTIDADGVALAGVKALDARTRALQKENVALRETLDALLQRIAHLEGKQP